jgi:hypothetical protein
LVGKPEETILRTGVDGESTYLKMDLIEIGWEGVDSIRMAQDRGRWSADVNTALNIQIYNMRGISSPAEELVAFQEKHCSMEFR